MIVFQILKADSELQALKFKPALSQQYRDNALKKYVKMYAWMR